MVRTAFRNLVAHKLRLLTTGLAVTLGVAFMAGTLVLTDTMQKTFDDLFTDVYENTDAVVRAEGVFEDPNGFGEIRGRVDAALVDTVKGVEGVRVAQGDVFGFARLVDKEGEAVGNPQMGAPTLGGNWSQSEELNVFSLVAGKPPAVDDEVVIDKKSADDAGYVVGDTATVLVKGGPLQVRVTGIAKFGEADSPAGASFVLFTPPVAQRLIAEPGKFDSISVVADDGISQGEIARRVAAVLPDGVESITGEAITTETTDAIEEGMSFFNQFMLIFAVIALLVGGFMIFNTFFITVAQRSRENALMRAVGATRRQVLASVMLEAVGVGVIASAAGLALGVAVAAGLKSMMKALGFDMPPGSLVFLPRTAVTAFLAGTIVTVVSAVSPARKAGKIPPIAALRDVAMSSAGYGSKERIIVGTGILGLGVAAMLYGLFGDVSNAFAVVGGAALLVFFGVSVLGRTVALPLSRFIGAPLPRARGIAGHLARENAMRNPKRTAATASALMIGVGLVGFITILASSTKASVNASVDDSFHGDLVVQSTDAQGFGGIDPSLAKRLNDLPEVGTATGLRNAMAEINGSPQFVLGVDPATFFGVMDPGVVAGDPAKLDADGIAVLDTTADDKNLKVGDKVTALFKDTGAKQFEVALIFDEQQPSAPADYMLGFAAFEANVTDQFDFSVFLTKAEGTSSAQTLAAVERVADEYAGTKVLDQAGYKEESTKQVDQLLGLIYALLGLAIVIALLGIGNTLALSILERTRELGVMRAVGMTRSQLRTTIRWESVIIALQGTLLGLVVGVFFGWALVRALNDQGITVFALPVVNLTVVVVLAALAGVVAAVLPARRAAKLNVLRAVVTE